MNAKRVSAAAGVILAAQKTRQTPAGIAAALEAAGLLQSPESAAERAQLQDDITGACLARHEEEQDAKRARFAAKLARKRAFDLRAERDAFADWADTLAYKVAPVEVLGRHGDEGKYPWGDALELLTPAAEVDALRARVAELEGDLDAGVNAAVRDALVGSAEPDPAAEVERWNAAHFVGSPVTAYPGRRPEDDPKCVRLVTHTRSAASVLGGHTAVVWVEGHGACIKLTHVDPHPGGAL